MRILNREQFLQLPKGVVFMKYTPVYTEDLAIKDETLEGRNDFVYADITGVNAVCTEEVELQTSERDCMTLALIAMGDGKPPGTVSFKIDLETYERDSFYVDKQLFMVYEQDDIDRLIAKLQTAVGATFPETTE